MNSNENSGAQSLSTEIKKRKRKKAIITTVIIVIVIALAVAFLPKLLKKNGGNKDIMTSFVGYGSITSIVEGSGITKTKSSETLTLATAGTVEEVFVTEGQDVMAGDPLFTINSPGAKSMLENAKSNYEGYRKQLDAIYIDMAGLNVSPKYSGKIIDTVMLQPGDVINKGMKLATLIDDRTMKLTQYFSYAYAESFHVGQSAEISVPSLMSVVSGTVEQVNMVSRISPEGSKLFSVVFSVPNEGVLTQGMSASASLNINGEIVYPYETGVLKYNRTSDLSASVSGTVISSALIDYLDVEEGEILVRIDAENTDNEIFNLEKLIEEAKAQLDKAQKNFDNCKAYAPIDGKVIGLAVYPEAAIAENSILCSIQDTTQIVINGTIDERNISYVKTGMPVELDQWGNMAFGYVDMVSWSSTFNNGVATYPVTIIADNFDGNIQVNSYINYRITASQSDNCLVVPLQSVRNTVLEDGTEASIVYVRDANPDLVVTLMYQDEEIPEGFSPVKVELGISDNANVEVLSGLNDGDEVFNQYISDSYWG